MIGRAARHAHGKVIFYADIITASMSKAIDTTEQRRKIQHGYNKLHKVVPRQIIKDIRKSILSARDTIQKNELEDTLGSKKDGVKKFISALELEMKRASKKMDFELAAKIRDRIEKIRKEKTTGTD